MRERRAHQDGWRRGRWRLAVILQLALLAMSAGCASAPGASTSAMRAATVAVTPAPTITSVASGADTASGPALPTFSDWRVAYIGQDGALHLVSLDGKTNLTGVSLPSYGHAGVEEVFTAGAASNGAQLLYGDASGATYVNLHADSATTLPEARTDYDNALLAWSPDGKAALIGSVNQPADIVRLPSGAISLAPPDNRVGNGMLVSIPGATYGWLDASHLAVEDLEIEDPTIPTPSRVFTPQTVASLASQDIATGQLRPIATFRSPTLVSGFFSLTPDGTAALFYNADVQDAPFTSIVRRIDIATGHVTPLSAIASVLPASQILWQPHGHKALVVTGFDGYQPIRFYLIDLDQDRVTPLALNGFPLAWTPDGATLVVERGKSLPPPAGQGSLTNGDGEEGPIPGFNDVGVIGSGPYTLVADSFGASWNITRTVTLTSQAMRIPVLGVVRNP